MNDSLGKWLGIIGIILAIIGFFWMTLWFGIIAIILGIIGLFTPSRTIASIALILGIILFIIALV